MSYADLRVVAIVLVLAASYGIFTFLFALEPQQEALDDPGNLDMNYSTPESSSFWDSVNNAISMQVNDPEIFFINSILFGTLGFLILFIGLRFFRGTG